MEFGISMFGDLYIDPNTGAVQAPQKRLQEMLEEVKLMDQVGLDYFGIGEHHRQDYAVSSPQMLLSAAASITQNIKLGSAVSVLSSTDPVRLFQEFAMLDLISNGRAEIMAGRGSFIESFPLFGYNLDDYNALFEEKLELLLELNKNESVRWEGSFRAPLFDQKVYPRPSKETLPIWIAVGGTPASVVRAAKLGLPLMIAIIGGAPRQFSPLFDLYKKVYQEHGHDPKKMQIGIHAHALFAADEEVLDKDYFPLYAAQMDRIGQSRGWPAYSKQQYAYGKSSMGALFIGEPNAIAEKILQVQNMFGLTRFAAHMDVGAPSHKQIMQAIELYGDKIIPQVKAALP